MVIPFLANQDFTPVLISIVTFELPGITIFEPRTCFYFTILYYIRQMSKLRILSMCGLLLMH